MAPDSTPTLRHTPTHVEVDIQITTWAPVLPARKVLPRTAALNRVVTVTIPKLNATRILRDKSTRFSATYFYSPQTRQYWSLKTRDLDGQARNFRNFTAGHIRADRIERNVTADSALFTRYDGCLDVFNDRDMPPLRIRDLPAEAISTTSQGNFYVTDPEAVLDAAESRLRETAGKLRIVGDALVASSSEPVLTLVADRIPYATSSVLPAYFVVKPLDEVPQENCIIELTASNIARLDTHGWRSGTINVDEEAFPRTALTLDEALEIATAGLEGRRKAVIESLTRSPGNSNSAYEKTSAYVNAYYEWAEIVTALENATLNPA